jgi:hypothetical protein
MVWELGSVPADNDITWLRRAVESVHDSDTHVDLIVDLWQALFVLRSTARATLSAESLRPLLSVLSTRKLNPLFGSEEVRRVAYFACGVLDTADHWLAHDELVQVLQNNSVWVYLGRAGYLNPFYVNIGEKLSREARWKQIISADLPGWVQYWPLIDDRNFPVFGDQHRTKFRSVLSRVWDIDEAEANEFGEEATLVLVFGALAKAWSEVRFSNLHKTQVLHHIDLLRETGPAAFSARIRDGKVFIASQRFKGTIMTRLVEALVRAGQNAKHERNGMDQHSKNGIDGLGDLLSRLASAIPVESPHMATGTGQLRLCGTAVRQA